VLGGWILLVLLHTMDIGGTIHLTLRMSYKSGGHYSNAMTHDGCMTMIVRFMSGLLIEPIVASN